VGGDQAKRRSGRRRSEEGLITQEARRRGRPRPPARGGYACGVEQLLPRFRYGVILPGTGRIHRGVDYQLYRLVPSDIMQIGVGLGVRDYSPENIDTAMSAFWGCVETLAAEGANTIVLSGVPVSAGLGRQRVLHLMAEVQQRHAIPLYATLEAIIAGLQRLDARSVAMASRFPAETNALIAAYLAAAGIEVSGATQRDLSLRDAQQLSLEDGMRLALEVGREAAAAFPHADALLVPGGATLMLHVSPTLEAEFDKPVLTNLSAEVWRALIAESVAPPVAGWGRLLASPPP